MLLENMKITKKSYNINLLFIFLAMISICCDNISIYDESIVIDSQIDSNEIITTLDINLAYVSLQENSFKLNLNLTNNINIDDVLNFGVVYGTSENPTLQDLRVNSTNISQSNLIEIENLEVSQNYFIRGFIITSAGVIYSSENLNIITPSQGAVLIKEIDLSSLQYINSLTYPYGTYSSSTWQISTTNCVEAPCITSGQSHGGFIEFNTNITTSGYLEFWVNAFNPGYNNPIPKVTINGIVYPNIEILSTNNSSFYFSKLRIGNIYAGNINVKIDFEENRNQIKSYTIDEIKFYNN